MFLTSAGQPRAESGSEVIDGLMDLYVDWREESFGVQLAYDRWTRGSADDREVAFAAYRAALEREESACRAFSERICRVTRGSRR
jgi:hypothetical protein